MSMEAKGPWWSPSLMMYLCQQNDIIAKDEDNRTMVNSYCTRSHFFFKYQIPGFLKVFGPKFQVFSSFLCQIPGTFIQILAIKISKCIKTDAGFPLLLWHKILIGKFQFFLRFWVKIRGLYHFLSKFQAFTRPGKENDKIPGFPGRVGTLLSIIATNVDGEDQH